MTDNNTLTTNTNTTAMTTADPLLCSTCAVTFHTSLQRREHMKSEWHIANVKRRVQTLQPLSREQHEERHNDSPVIESQKKPYVRCSKENVESSDEESDHESDSSDASGIETLLDPMRCLFCLHESSTIEMNIFHMETAHDFRIPNIGQLNEGWEPLLWYLDLVINRFHCCLYCGHSKNSAEATRAHMLDKGHCMLDMSPESEYLDFWNQTANAENDIESDGEYHGNQHSKPRLLSPDALALGSGRIVVSRKNHSHLQERNRSRRKENSSLVKTDRAEQSSDEHTEQSTSKDVQLLSNRDRMGLVGLSNAEQRLVLATEKRMRSKSSRKWSARHWTTENLSTSIKRTVFKQNLAGG